MDENFKILYVIKMLKKIFKDVIVLIWILVLLLITRNIKTFYLISFDNLHAIGNSSQHYRCRLHTNCFLTYFPPSHFSWSTTSFMIFMTQTLGIFLPILSFPSFSWFQVYDVFWILVLWSCWGALNYAWNL